MSRYKPHRLSEPRIPKPSCRTMAVIVAVVVAVYILHSQFAAVSTEEGLRPAESSRPAASLAEAKWEPDEASEIAAVSAVTTKPKSGRSFVIKGNVFLKDGEEFSFHAGTAHYWRRMPEYWEDTMIKLKAMGLNALETYISWNLHEPEPEHYDFEGALDIIHYLKLAQKHGLLVVLRPGPFINAEMVMGGLPYWLLRENPSMRLRTSDPSYTNFVKRWFQKLLPMLKPLLYVNGGPIIMVQIENEYGSYFACDHDYVNSLLDLNREILGPDVLLFTTDGPTKPMLACGPAKGALSTVDFGGGNDVTSILSNYRELFPEGPFVNSEFYPGWINHWGRKYKIVPSAPILQTMKDLLKINASFVIYPAVGGTNFGFLAGPNMFREGFTPGTTSYDFNAPVSEAGDTTEKFIEIRNLLQEFGYKATIDMPPENPKKAYGGVQMKYCGHVFEFLGSLSPRKAEQPLSFEALNHPDGFVLYRTIVPEGSYLDPSILNVSILHDRGTVFLDKKFVGILSRATNLTAMNIPVQKGQVLDILVQNEGRLTAGPFINDSKGILGPVYLDTTVLLNWEHFPITLPSYPVKEPAPLILGDPKDPSADDLSKPAFFSGTFRSDPPQNTFLDLTGWRQGYAFINGHNLGRYWPTRGPFVTLFIPGAMLKQSGDNVLQLFELGGSPCDAAGSCAVKFVETHIITETEIFKHHVWNFYNGH